MADWNLKRRKHERTIASEIAQEIHRVLGPVAPEALADKSEVICKIFADAFDSHGVVSEASGARILKYVPKILARLNQSFADLNQKLDAPIRS